MCVFRFAEALIHTLNWTRLKEQECFTINGAFRNRSAFNFHSFECRTVADARFKCMLNEECGMQSLSETR